MQNRPPSTNLGIFPQKANIALADEPEVKRRSDYPKRQTVPDTGQGNNFAVHQAMHAGIYYAFENKTPFQFHIEDTDYGDFDDLVIVTPSKVDSYQFKSRVGSDPATLGYFLTEGGSKKELMLYKYFNSIGQRIAGASGMLEEHYILLSNQDLPKELSDHLDAEGSFKDSFFSSKEPQVRLVHDLIYASIAKHSEKSLLPDSPLTGTQLADFLAWYLDVSGVPQAFKQELFVFAKEHLKEKGSRFSEDKKNTIIKKYLDALQGKRPNGEIQGLIDLLKKYNKNTHTINLYELACAPFVKDAANIKLFLKRLVFKFGQPSLAQLIKINREKIERIFNTTNDAIYHAYFHEFYDWLIDHVGTIIDNAKLKQLFAGWQHKYIYLERLCGLTKLKLESINDEILGRSFPRVEELKELSDFMQAAAPLPGKKSTYIRVLEGKAGVGKSCLVKKLITSLNLVDGVCLFVDAKDLWKLVKKKEGIQQDTEEFSIQHLKRVKLICLDNSELIPEEKDLLKFIIKFIQDLEDTSIRMILLTKSEGLPAQLTLSSDSYRTLTIMPIRFADVLTTFPEVNDLFALDDESVDVVAHPSTTARDVYPSFFMDDSEDGEPSLPQHILPFKGMAELLTIPFYLNLIIRYHQNLPQTADFYRQPFTHLESYLTKLAIEKPSLSSVTVHLEDKETKAEQRKSTLRRIVYANNKGEGIKHYTQTDHETIKELIEDGILQQAEDHFPRDETIKELIKDGVLQQTEDHSPREDIFRFTHLLYRQWVVRDIVNTRFRITREIGTEEEAVRLIDDLSRLLSEDRYVWGMMLRDDESLKRLVESNNEYFLEESDNFSNLARLAINTENQTLLEQCYPSIRKPSNPLSTRWEIITFLGEALAARNKAATAFLLRRGAAIGQSWVEIDYDDTAEMPSDDEYYADPNDVHDWDMGDTRSGFYVEAPPHNEGLPSDLYQLENAAKTNDPDLVGLVLKHAPKRILTEDVPMTYISSGPEPDDEDRIPWYHETVMHIAISKNYEALVAALIKFFHNNSRILTRQDFYGHTPLHRVVLNSYFDEKSYPNFSEEAITNYNIFKLILNEYRRRRLDLNMQDVLGRTPLHLAILKRDPIMVSALVDAGASLEIEDKNDLTPQAMIDKINPELRVKLLSDVTEPFPDTSCLQITLDKFVSQFFAPADSKPDAIKKKRKAKSLTPENEIAKRMREGDFQDEPEFIAVPRTAEQDGWSCFDIAVGLKRASLVEFARRDSHDLEFRRLLAPEIRNAAVITADIMNQESGNAKHLAELFCLLEVAREYGEAEHQQGVVSEIHAVLASNHPLVALERYALPEEMRSPEIQKLVNDYCDAHDSIQPDVSLCNDKLNALDHPKRLTLAELDNFFKDKENQEKYAEAYNTFLERRNAIFKSAADKLNAYCMKRTTYENYVNNYYGKNNWFAFQPSYSGDYQTSMVDIAAKLLNCQIIILQRKDGGWNELYRTPSSKNKRYVQFTGNHFVQLQLNPNYIKKCVETVKQLGLFKITSTARPSRSERERPRLNEEGITSLVSSYLR